MHIRICKYKNVQSTDYGLPNVCMCYIQFQACVEVRECGKEEVEEGVEPVTMEALHQFRCKISFAGTCSTHYTKYQLYSLQHKNFLK